VAFAPDGRILATGDTGGTITLWDLDDGNRSTTLPGRRGAIRDLAINPEGTLLAAVPRSRVACADG
jgi:WD40 repeat protein